MSAELSFPWTQQNGLAAILDDGQLWAMVLTFGTAPQRVQDLRKGLKQLMKRIRRGRIDVSDDASFGRAIAMSLRSARDRQRLTDEMSRAHAGSLTDFLGRQLLAWLLSDAHRHDMLGAIGDEPAQVEQVLRAGSMDARLWPVACFAAARALLEPSRGRDWADALLAAHPQFAKFVAAGQSDEDGDVGDAAVDDPPIQEPAVPAASEPVEERDERVEALQRLLQRYSEWTTRMSPAELERALELLAGLAEGPRSALRDLEAARQRLQRQIDDLPDHPILQLLRHELPGATTQQSSLAALRVGIERRAAALANVRQAADRIEVLCERLAVEPEWPTIPGGVLDSPIDERIAALERILDELGGELQARLARVDAEEEAADRLLSEWSQLDRGGELALDLDAELAPALHLLLQGCLRTHRRERLAPLVADRRLLVVLFAVLAARDRPAACSLLVELAHGLRAELVAPLLAALDDATLHELAADPKLPVELGERLFSLALTSGRGDLLAELAPHFHGEPAITELFHAVRLQARTRDLADIARRLVQLAHEVSKAASDDSQQRVRELKQNVIDRLTLPPGMTRLHQELRGYAQQIVRRALKVDVEGDHAAAALTAFTRIGTLDHMVQVAIDQLDPVSVRNLTEIHRKNTRTFLAEIERDLRAWVTAATPAPGDSLAPAVRGLAAAGRPRGEAFLGALRRLGDEPTIQALLAGPELADPEGEIEPVHTASFIALCDGRPVTAELYVADRLRVVLGRGPGSSAEAVDELLRRRVLHAARLAAGDDPELLRRVDASAQQRREGILREHEGSLAEARGSAPDSEEIAVRLQLFEEALGAEDFENAESLVRELADDLQRHRLLQDPERRYALDFLRDAGGSPAIDEPLEQLQARVGAVRTANASRRMHIDFLLHACDDPALGAAVQPHFAPLARRLDRLSHWPSDKLAEKLADSIHEVSRYLLTQVTYRAEQPETVDHLLEALPRYVTDRLQTLVDERAADPLAELVGLIRAYHQPSRILQFVAPPRLPSVEAVRPAARAPRQAVSIQRESGGDELAAHIRRYLARLVEQTPDPRADGPRTVDEAVRAKDWPALRRIAAGLVRAHGSAPGQSSRLPVAEGVFAFARARESLTDRPTPDVTLIYEVVAVFWAKSDLQQFDLAGELDLLIVEALDDSAKRSGADLGARGAALIAEVVAARRDDPKYAWSVELMWAAAQVQDRDVPASARIAETLWELLKPQNNPNPRADLLHWLYRLRCEEALRQLANQSPNPSFAVQCIHAFTRAESDPDVRARALQMSAAFREQTARRKNRQPWILLFLRLESTSAQVDVDVAPVEVQALDRVVQDRHGEFDLAVLVEARLSADPPEALALRFFDEPVIELISGDDDLLTARTIHARLPLPPRIRGGDLLAVPFTITGRTFGGRTFEARGSLDLELAGEATNPVRREEVLGAWPGASGRPVQHDEGFFGREDEIRQIDLRLRSDRGQGSLMLFGQRRVGKTSLLLEMVRLLPPRPGHVAGVFLDVSNLDLPDNMSMSQRFFAAIVHALGDPRNAAVREQLDVEERNIHRLFRGIDASLSLYTALHSLRDRLRERSGERICRLAFFVDEFDRFVEPLLLGHEEQVDRMMWDLRQIVQQSRDISLVLAGSGLQKMLTRDYSRPLHGSIDQIEIRPFVWERDREAILATFLPESIRGRLCRPENIDAVARHAATLCGGHPYFLALVGQAAGLSADGRSVNVPVVNDAARRLIASSLPELVRIDEQVFYSHIFDTLKRVPVRERLLAQILLVHIAVRTTETDRWLNLGDALEVPDLLRITREADRERALRLLLDEGAVAQDPAQRVRITVPVTALALRRGAARLRHEALQRLSASTGGPS
ncbi:AAA family ATPase [Nannocystis bainbridge]|uniref:AAA family ATPase n=1 Tax=Nannocystis bainbridge TaxID=2995303 RepID=A0ABT5E747_9BACT|nr:AAA family ATPase [Nannocystis bainbridge]MDC0721688.1 AAA family ATPase [Nannocystis bainbridge]